MEKRNLKRYVCIHGHFYQPPRENPWLEAVEQQDSAQPYHDWNERITAECYEPNAWSRILNEQGRIWRIVNNYASISFDFGPTLLSWMQQHAPEVYAAILEADRQSMERFGGHGSALAQAFHHAILPLCNDRDKYTQVIWGIADFEHRFGRKPEGMWLPETAVNTPTLEVLAAHDIKFTILAPHQAARVRKIGSGRWKSLQESRIDSSRPYLCRLPSGRSIALFFYNGPVSQAVAFEKLLDTGEAFAHRLIEAFSESCDWPQLAHIATDGESYGHHHRHGDMALAYAIHHIESTNAAIVTNYGEFLELYPPTHEVQIVEDSSWSCAHGIERWKSNCGCSSGRAGWNQEWRAPLREAFDWLRDALAPQYEQACTGIFHDPWNARNAYINVLLDRSEERLSALFSEHAAGEIDRVQMVRALKLLEMQRHLMLMYTSCGWFFDDLSGIETLQVIQYASRAVQLAEDLFGEGLENEFLTRLERARSNIAEHGNGRQIYEKLVKRAMVDLRKVAAHFAMSSLFENYGEQERIYAYDVHHQPLRTISTGQARFATGTLCVTSIVTLECETLEYAVLHLGGHLLNAGVQLSEPPDDFAAFVSTVEQAFARADFAEALRLIDKRFAGGVYTLSTLFADEQRRVLKRVLESTTSALEADYRRIFEHHVPLMRFLMNIGVPLPRALQMPAEFVINTELRRMLEQESPDPDAIAAMLQEAHDCAVDLDTSILAFTMRNTLRRHAELMQRDPHHTAMLERFAHLVDIANALPFEVDLNKAQNAFYETMQSELSAYRQRSSKGDEAATAWLAAFEKLGEKLRMQVPP